MAAVGKRRWYGRNYMAMEKKQVIDGNKQTVPQ
jgi:hypothetical protein